MKGLVVNGFTVVEALGSGQGGILYLARDSEGREAVIRVARDGEDNVSIRVFIEEARQLLPQASEVETSTASDGRRMLMALSTPRAPPPGSGQTQHAVTQRLPRAAPPELPARSKAPVALLLVALAVFGAGAAMVAMALRTPSVATVAARPEVAPLAAPPVAPSPAVPVDAGLAPVVAAEPVEVAAPRKPTANSNSAGLRPCTLDSRWRKSVDAELEPIQAVTAVLGSETFRAFDDAAAPILAELDRRADGADCRDLDAKVEALVNTWLKRLRPHACAPDDAWRASARKRLAAAELPAGAQQAIEAQIDGARRWADCVKVDLQLRQSKG
jgi:hypothetical protein